MLNSDRAHDMVLHWTEWNKLKLPDGMTIYDPDGFRGNRPVSVTFAEFLEARNECTLVEFRDTPFQRPDFCNPAYDYHSNPHRRCILR